MAFNIRNLVSRLREIRPDNILDSQLLSALNNAVRQLCSRSGGAIETISTAPVLLNSTTHTVTPTLGDLVFVNRVWMPRLSSDGTDSDYIGTYDASTGNTVPANGSYVIEDDSASHFTKNGFYICSHAGNLLPDDVEWSSNIGDIMYSDGVNWQHIRKEEFEEIPIVSKTTVSQWGITQADHGEVRQCAIDNGVITFYPTVKYDTAILTEVSYIPTNVTGMIPLSVWTEDIILNGALSHILMLPGPGQDKKLAIEYGRRFLIGLNNAASATRLGETGVPMIKPPDFFGRG